MARYTRKARNTSGNNRHSNANTQFSSGVHSGRRDMHGGNGGGGVMAPCPPGMSPCPDGTCITTGIACPPPQRGPIVTTGGGMDTGNTVQGMRMCGGTGQNAMGSCPPGMVCTQGVCMLPEITVTPRGASQSYRRGGRVNRKFKPVRSNPRRRR